VVTSVESAPAKVAIDSTNGSTTAKTVVTVDSAVLVDVKADLILLQSDIYVFLCAVFSAL
jgi:hypothetical protein